MGDVCKLDKRINKSFFSQNVPLRGILKDKIRKIFKPATQNNFLAFKFRLQAIF